VIDLTKTDKTDTKKTKQTNGLPTAVGCEPDNEKQTTTPTSDAYTQMLMDMNKLQADVNLVQKSQIVEYQRTIAEMKQNKNFLEIQTRMDLYLVHAHLWDAQNHIKSLEQEIQRLKSKTEHTSTTVQVKKK
jgi:hypothetical protein